MRSAEAMHGHARVGAPAGELALLASMAWAKLQGPFNFARLDLFRNRRGGLGPQEGQRPQALHAASKPHMSRSSGLSARRQTPPPPTVWHARGQFELFVLGFLWFYSFCCTPASGNVMSAALVLNTTGRHGKNGVFLKNKDNRPPGPSLCLT